MSKRGKRVGKREKEKERKKKKGRRKADGARSKSYQGKALPKLN